MAVPQNIENTFISLAPCPGFICWQSDGAPLTVNYRTMNSAPLRAAWPELLSAAAASRHRRRLFE